ncbi:MAG TPA: REJ domain-containing protein [Gammaproteobacteria bacterium]
MAPLSAARASTFVLPFLLLSACGGGGGGGTVNQPPAVSIETAPGNITKNGVAEGADITLRAVASDPDGNTIESFSWKQLAGGHEFDLSDADDAELVLKAPDVSVDGDRYAFSVTVQDSEGADSSATVAFDVNFVNKPPQVALKVESAEAAEGTVVRFDASGSTDPDEQTLAFQWEQVDTGNGMPAAAIVDNGDGTADVTLPNIANVLNGERLRIRVTANDQHDGDQMAASAEAGIGVLFVNGEPQLQAIVVSEETVNEGALDPAVTIAVDAFDADDDTLTYMWDVPGGFVADGVGSNILTVSATPDVGVLGETFEFDVHVSDSLTTSVFTTSLTVNFVNVAPVISAAGSNFTAGGNVELAVTASDSDLQELGYSWTQNPADERQVDLAANADGSAGFAAPNVSTQTDLHFTVIVSDGDLIDSADVTVTIDPDNAPPVINDVEQTETEIDESDTVGITFTVNATDDHTDTANLTYVWDVPEDFAGMTEGDTTNQLRIIATPNVIADTPYDFSVVVRDESNAEARADFDLLVRFVNQDPTVSIEIVSPADLADVDPAEGTQIHLLASGEDDDEHELSYVWSAPALGVDSQEGDEFIVILPEVQADQPVTVQVTASDGAGGSANDSIDFMILDGPETPEVTIVVEDSVYSGYPLSLAALTENLATPITYAWTETGGVSLGINGMTSQTIDLSEVPDVDEDGEIVTIGVTATGSDGVANSEVEITVSQRPAAMPLPFSFNDLNDVPVGRTTAIGGLSIDSSVVTIEGLQDGEPAPINVTGGSYSLDGGMTFIEEASEVFNGQSVAVRVEGPAASEGTESVSLNVGGYEDTFSVDGIDSGLAAEGVPGGVRWSWAEMQGVESYRISRAAPSMTTAVALADIEGDVTQFEHQIPVWAAGWGTTLQTRDRYDLGAFDVEGILRDVLGSQQSLPQQASVDAITYIKRGDEDVREEEGRVFGSAIAVSDDGQVMVVGAPGESVATEDREGRVHVYRHDGVQWTWLQALSGQNAGARFGAAVALSGDGNVLAVGVPGTDLDDGAMEDAGEVRVFRMGGDGQFPDEEELALRPGGDATGDRFGSALALNTDGTLLAVGVPLDDRSSSIAGPEDEGATDSGAVYVYRHDGTAWAPDVYLKEPTPAASNRFGTAVALTGIVGSNNNRLFASRTGGAATVFVLDRPSVGTWAPPTTGTISTVSRPTPGYGETLSAPRNGASFGLRFVSGSVVHRVVGFSPNQQWTTVDLMSAPSSQRPTGVPVSAVMGRAPDVTDALAYYVALGVNAPDTVSGSGAYRAVPVSGADSAGAVYIFNVTGAPSFRSFLKAPNADDGDDFGRCLAWSGGAITRLHVCAPGEDSAGIGVHPVDMREDDSRLDAGAVYVY